MSRAIVIQGALFIFISAVAILSSCKKTDLQSTVTAEINPVVVNNFFKVPANTDELVKRIASAIQQLDNKSGFVTDFAAKNGYPLWDKIIALRGNANTQPDILSLNEIDTMVYIPLVQQDSLHVNGYILARVNAESIALSYALAQDYKAYPKIKTGTQLTAAEFVILIVNLEKTVFGYHDFLVTDNSLFYDSESDTRNGAIITKTITLSDSIPAHSDNLLSMETYCQDVTITVCVNPVANIKNPVQGATGYDPCHNYTYQNCWDVYTDDGNSGGGTTPTGGGGGEIHHDYPCAPVPYRQADPLPPCPPPAPGPGTTPNPFIYTSDTDLFTFYSRSGIDLEKYMNCFNQIPSAGATFTVKLCADIPVNDDPYKINTLSSGGHVFLTLTKSNGENSISQTVGFYPQNGTFAFLGLPQPSKVVNDEIHEYNASLKMDVSEANFLSIVNTALANQSSSYDINNYNCADFALNSFNAGRNNPLNIPDTYTSIGAFFGKTPVGLYRKLKNMKTHNDPENDNIEIGTFTSPQSHGPCN